MESEMKKIGMMLLAVMVLSCGSKKKADEDAVVDVVEDVQDAVDAMDAVSEVEDVTEEIVVDIVDDESSDAGEDGTDAVDASEAPEDVAEDAERTTDDLPGGDGDTCDQAFEVDRIPFRVAGSLADSSSDLSAPPDACPGLTMGGGDGVEEVFVFTPDTTTTYRIRVTSRVSSTVTYVVTDCSDVDGTCLGGSRRTGDQWIDLELASGTTYYIIVDSTSTGPSVDYVLEIDVL
jgi:hypothetical protein